MPAEIRAVIDVGTNSVKLLVADVDGRTVRPLHEASHQTRLGQGFYETHRLQPGAMRETARAVAEFRDQAAAFKPVRIRVIATSAARDAQNKDELLHAITTSSGLQVSIISGEQEADWAYQGVTSDPALLSHPLLVIDVGGGSTEFILGRAGHRIFGESFSVGSVRLLERFPLSDPPTPAQLLQHQSEVSQILEEQARPRLSEFLRSLPRPEAEHHTQGVQLVATGGTSTILARVHRQLRSFDRELIEGTVLSHEDIQRQKQRLWSLPLEARRSIIGLPANRADVILPGVVIFERVMATFGFHSLRVSTRGIRFAALMDPE